MKKAVAVVSGGMDSATLLYYMLDKGYEVICVSFDYGQRHRVELGYSQRLTEYLIDEGADIAAHHVISLPITQYLHGSALTDEIDVPEGHYAADNMKQTVVANRNAIMLSVATGVAVAENAEVVAAGMHAGDHPIYSDCRPEFVYHFDKMMKVANEGYGHPNLHLDAPFVNRTKADIARIGDELGVVWEKTWSCYKGGEIHCGKCGTCVERREAFQLAEVSDPTPYEYEGALPSEPVAV